MEGNSNTNIPTYDAWKSQDAKRSGQLTQFPEKRSTKHQRLQSSQDSQTEVTIFDDLLFQILIFISAESLFKLQFVCKQWLNLINSPTFIKSHAQQANTILISRRLFLSKLFNPAKPKYYFVFLNLDGGGPNSIETSIVKPIDILATCDGLVLAATGMDKSLTLTNPITREHAELPSLTKGYFGRYESLGIAFCEGMNTYKILHLFGDGFKRTAGCKIMNVCEKKWRHIEAPDYESLIGSRKKPVPIGGSLSWTPMQWRDYFLSFDLNDEKFVCKKLPVTSCSSWDRLLEIQGNLGFVTNLQQYAMHVWIMVADGGSAGENWIKKYSVGLCVDRTFPIPICCLNGKRTAREIGKNEIAYKFPEIGQMEVIEVGTGLEVLGLISEFGGFLECMEKDYIPHRNTLASIM